MRDNYTYEFGQAIEAHEEAKAIRLNPGLALVEIDEVGAPTASDQDQYRVDGSIVYGASR